MLKRSQYLGDRLAERTVYVLLSALVLVFIFYPYLSIFVQALSEAGESWGHFLANNWLLLSHSLTVATVTMVFSLVLSLLLTIFFTFTRPRLHRFLQLILLVTMVAPPFVTSLAYITLFGRRGMITYDLLKLNIDPYGPIGIILMQTLSFTSLNTLVLISLLKKIDPVLVNSARALGASASAVVRDVIIPLLRPGLVVVALVSFIRSLADFQTPTIIGGNYQVLASTGYLVMISMGDLHKAALINLTLAIPALAVFWVYIRYDQVLAFQQHGTSNTETAFPIPKRGIFWLLSLLGSVGFYLVLLLQYGSIVLNAISVRILGAYHLSIQPIIDTEMYINDTVWRTIFYSIIAGLLGSLISFLIIYYSQVRHSRWMHLMEMVGTFPYILPGTFFGLGYIYAFSQPPLLLTGTSVIVLINVIFKQVAFATKAAKAVTNQVDPTYFRTVNDLGGSTIAEWRDVFFPLTRQGFALTFLNGFISTMTTIGSIIFLVNPGQKLLTLVMFDVIQRNEYQIAAVIACLIILICVAMAGIVFGLLKLSRKDWSHVFSRQ